MEANTYVAITLGWGFVLIFAGILFSALTTSRKLDRMLHIFCDGVIVINLWRKPIGLPMGGKPLFFDLTFA